MKKNIMVVDDSALMRRVLSDIINGTSKYEVKYQVSNGVDGLYRLDSGDVDMILLDMRMAGMDGLEFMRILAENQAKIPVIIISGYAKRDTKDTIEALKLGAFEFVRKPENILHDREEFTETLLDVMDQAFLAKEKPAKDYTGHVKTVALPQRTSEETLAARKLVAIACSTGGPRALQTLLPMLPANLNAPVVLVQHMPVGFTKSLSERLDQMSDISVTESEDGETLEKGHVYIARGGKHLLVEQSGKQHVLKLSGKSQVSGLRPYANYLYESLIDTDYDEIVCVVLTGMGSDGKAGILKLREQKPVCIIAQDAETSEIYGMPRAIAETGFVNQILPLSEIADAIKKQVGVY